MNTWLTFTSALLGKVAQIPVGANTPTAPNEAPTWAPDHVLAVPLAAPATPPRVLPVSRPTWRVVTWVDLQMGQTVMESSLRWTQKSPGHANVHRACGWGEVRPTRGWSGWGYLDGNRYIWNSREFKCSWIQLWAACRADGQCWNAFLGRRLMVQVLVCSPSLCPSCLGSMPAAYTC